MLSTMVGTLLAFVTVMLILSLIVTSLVQFTQATLRLRGRNLLQGVAVLIQKHAPHAASAAAAGPATTASASPPAAVAGASDAQGAKAAAAASDDDSPLRKDTYLKLAAHALNATNAAVTVLPNPNGTRRVIAGPPVSWVDPDDLAAAIAKKHPVTAKAGENLAETPDETQAKLKQAFQDMEPGLAKRFQFWIRILTVVWSFLVAFAFQLSTPELLKQLPSQDAKRAAILAAVPGLTNESTRQLAYSSDNVLEKSLSRLGKDYPQYVDLFQRVSGESDTKQVMMDEMRQVLGKREDRDAVLADYSSIIDSLSTSAANTAIANSSKFIDQLDTFGISPKLDDFGFFFSAPQSTDGGKTWHRVFHWTAIFGVLITGILLSLGAPFWFEMLKNLSSLKDAMNPTAGSANKT